MPAAAGVYEEFGFLFTAKDLASAVIKKTGSAVDAVAGGVQKSLDGIVMGVETTGVAVAKGLNAGLVKPFKSVFEDSLVSSVHVFMRAGSKIVPQLEETFKNAAGAVTGFTKDTTKAIKNFSEDVVVAAIHGGMRAAAAVYNFPERVQKGLTAVKDTTKEFAKSVYDLVAKKEFSFEGFFDATVTGALAAKKGIGQFFIDFKQRAGEGAVTFKTGILSPMMSFFDTVKKNAGGVGGKLKGLWASFKSWDQAKDAKGKGGKGAAGFDGMMGGQDPAKQFGKMRTGINALGGVFKSGLIGPLGLVLKLLEPLTEILSETLEPIMETIKIAMRNAFAPAAALIENIMQTLMPLIMKGLQPLVSIFTLIVAKVGYFVQAIAQGKGPALNIQKVFTSLAPVFNKLFTAIQGAANKILPVVFNLIEKLLPIVTRLAEIFVEMIADRIEMVGDIIAEAGPDLVDALVEMLEALIPLVAITAKFGTVLLKYVFAPALVKTVQALAWGIKNILTPFLNWLVPKVTKFLQYLIDAVVEFYGNFEKYMRQAYVLFVEPVIEWFTGEASLKGMLSGAIDKVIVFFTNLYDTVKEWIKKITTWVSETVTGMLETVGLGKVPEKVGNAFDAVIKAVQSPIETMKTLINVGIIDPLNKIIGYEFPLKIGSLKKLLGLTEIQKLAEGGIATRATQALIGEAGAEAVIPLKPEPIREIVAPIVADLEMPMLREVVNILSDIHKALRGTLKVASQDAGGGGGERLQGNAGPSRGSEAADLDAAIGIMGIAR